MISVRRMWQGGMVALLALAGWLAFYGTALAAPPPVKPKPTESINSTVYVMAYFIVIFGIALGTLFVCRASNRRERARPEQFAESKAFKAEEEDE